MVPIKWESRAFDCRPKILENPDQELRMEGIQSIALSTLFVCYVHVAGEFSYTSAHFLWIYDPFLKRRMI